MLLTRNDSVGGGGDNDNDGDDGDDQAVLPTVIMILVSTAE
jgi:hypothetical protein